ncbi:hypothetical protein [Cyclobacterium amurskyense]|uniref:Uncharacterized protein n=1 Tax=Cyclobacterium amurskyense TaxID=320787 RepID=A0A0H4P8L6_9BACT|nr:hypothetical protein [Cyclobacterium amurskyense]AKP50831.1 hypothetical protein CA2015_1388 [Cyclobacterium amurskyense]
MPCKSPSLERVTEKSEKAKKQIEQLNKQLSDLENSAKEKFEKKIKEHSEKANVYDFRQLIFNSAIKTEYSHEFSLDKIAPVISAALEAVSQSLTGGVMQILTSPKAVSSYSDLVLSISEAAKSTSSASNSLSFSANRIAPGVFAFLSANSISIKDKDTFGEEAVTATSIFYSLNNSIEDLKQSTSFELAYLNAELMLKFKNIQIGNTDDLSKGLITIAVWNEKYLLIEEIMKNIRERLDNSTFKDIIARSKDEDVDIDSTLFNTSKNRLILEQSVLQFENRGSLYKGALENAKTMLNNPLF